MSEEDLAATKIQAQFRGAGVRKSMNGAAEQDSGDGELLTKEVVKAGLSQMGPSADGLKTVFLKLTAAVRSAGPRPCLPRATAAPTSARPYPVQCGAGDRARPAGLWGPGCRPAPQSRRCCFISPFDAHHPHHPITTEP
jgi:hypothetical protein